MLYYESAWAKGATPTLFTGTFSDWGWSNLIKPGETQTIDLWAGAAKSDTSKGILAGKIRVVYKGGLVSGEFMTDPGFTVAPGQYAQLSDIGPSTGDLYVIAHAVVGMPDPSFGPAD